MRTLLLIVHLQFQKVPASLSSNTLAEVARLCVKYDAQRLVGMFGGNWLKSYQHNENPKSLHDLQSHFCLADIFQDHEHSAASFEIS
jgi:hypothetical protein